MTETLDVMQDVTMETMTGADVARVREAYKLGRSELAVMCGFPSTGVRIHNIEKKDSWKPGDREKVFPVLVGLAANPPRDKIGRIRGESGSERADRLVNMMRPRDTSDAPNVRDAPTLVISNLDDDDDVGLVVPDVSEDNLVELGESWTSDPSVVDDFVDDVVLADGGVVAVDDGARMLTNSEVAVWQRCRRKWWLSVYRMLALKQRDFMGPRAVGGRVHRALAAWYVPEGQQRTDPREALERVIVEDWTALAAQERERPSYIDDETSLGELAARFNESVSLERAMIEGYVEWVVEQGDDANLRVTAPETMMTAAVEGDVAGEHVSVTALGLLDVRVTRVADGVRLFEDHKTLGNLTQHRKTLHMDPQMLHYHLLEWLNTPDGETRCDGALYNMLRRVKRTAQAKPPFYDRVEVRHNAYELDAYRRRLLGAARDIQRAERELDTGADPMSVVYPNPTDDCSWSCDFFPVCPMLDDGSRVEDALAALYRVQDPMARYDQTKNE